jgi:hypothetical protein
MSIVEGGSAMTESRFAVTHVRMTSDRPFADVQAEFEQRLGCFEPDVYQPLAEGGDPARVGRRRERPFRPSHPSDAQNISILCMNTGRRGS